MAYKHARRLLAIEKEIRSLHLPVLLISEMTAETYVIDNSDGTEYTRAELDDYIGRHGITHIIIDNIPYTDNEHKYPPIGKKPRSHPLRFVTRDPDIEDDTPYNEALNYWKLH